MDISERIRHFRSVKGLTQQQVADKVGVTSAAISGFERGVAEPRQSTLAAIADACGISLSKFWGPITKPAA